MISCMSPASGPGLGGRGEGGTWAPGQACQVGPAGGSDIGAGDSGGGGTSTRKGPGPGPRFACLYLCMVSYIISDIMYDIKHDIIYNV